MILLPVLLEIKDFVDETVDDEELFLAVLNLGDALDQPDSDEATFFLVLETDEPATDKADIADNLDTTDNVDITDDVETIDEELLEFRIRDFFFGERNVEGRDLPNDFFSEEDDMSFAWVFFVFDLLFSPALLVDFTKRDVGF